MLPPLTAENDSILSYYLGKYRDLGRIPRRADIDPGEMVSFLPSVILIDRLGEGRFRMRLSGTKVDMAAGGPVPRVEITPDLFGPGSAGYLAVLEQVCTRREAALTVEWAPRGGNGRYCQSILLPLMGRDEADGPVMIFGGFTLLAPEAQRDPPAGLLSYHVESVTWCGLDTLAQAGTVPVAG